MKKQLLCTSLFMFLGMGLTQAQIAITLADMPTAGTNIITGSDTIYNGSAGTTGTNQVWNFSSLSTHTNEAYSFVAASGQPGASNFSGANLCMPMPADSMWQYLTTNSSGVFMNGIYNTGSSFPTSLLKYNPPSQLLKFPCTYNSTYINTAKASIKMAVASPPIDSMWFKTTIAQSSIMDAWGSLTTPGGTYNVLRQKRTEIQTDSTFYHAFGSWIFNDETVDTTIYWVWWANGKKYPVLEMNDNGGVGVKGSVSFLISNATGINDIPETQLSILAYPNPATNEMNFILPSGKASLEIVDVLGKIVRSYEINKSELTIDVSELQNGNYSFRYTSVENGNILHGKLIVAH